jgi:hexosaminidase
MSTRRSCHLFVWRLTLSIFCACLLVSCAAPAVTPAPATPAPIPSPIDVIPRPVSVSAGSGNFILASTTGIYVQPGTDEAMAVGQYLADHLRPATGYSLPVRAASGAPAGGNITLTLTGADPALGPEGYQLTVTPDQVTLAADQPAGLFYAIQTLRQLLPPAVDSPAPQPGPWTLAAVTIKDYPRFAWRGAMLDVARHFFSVADVQQYIDLLASYKINRLHLHLADDQGWRIEIKSWPNLTAIGSSSQVGGGPGGYYTQADYARLVAFARSRYITIVPEIDMPDHTNAALASYPELNCSGQAPALYTGTDVGFSSLCTNKDITYKFLDDVIGELAALTPGPYIHIGGDESNATQPADYLQFVTRVQAIVQAHGKHAVGWEEIAQTRLLPGSIAQHWNLGPGFAAQAARQGAKVLMSPADRAYMDMKYDPSTPLGQDWAGTISVEQGYSWDPAAVVGGVPENDILGVEAPLWSETLVTLSDIESMAFPRLLGYAEIGWSPQSLRDWTDYKLRLASQGPRLQALGVNFYKAPEIPWK